MLSILKTTTYTDKDANGDFFTMEEAHQRLTKTITASGFRMPSSYPKYFKLLEARDVKTLLELLPILENLGKQSDCMVVRGSFSNNRIGDKVRRKAINVAMSASEIIALDVDELDLPAGMGKTDLKAQGEYVCHLLHTTYPEMFPDDMGFIAQGSSSSGLGEKIKLHLWLRNYFKVTQGQLRNLFSIVNSRYKKEHSKNINLIDTALFHPAQAHYTAYPIFENVKDDPYKDKGRTIYVYGNDSYISEDFPEYIRPIALSKNEATEYEEKVIGSKIICSKVYKAIDRVLYWGSPTESGVRTKVLACFHEAIQNQVCFNEVRRYLRPSVEELRPGMSEDYFSQGVISALGNIKALSSREIPLECKGLDLKTIDGGNDPKYLKLEETFPLDSVTFLKATLGTGKTNTIERWLHEGKITGKVLAITDTSALVEANAARFNAGDFRKATTRLEYAAGTLTRLSGTLHSLKKIKDFARDFDFVFIDEADSVMNNLLFASIISEDKKQEIIDVLHDLLTYSKRVVISDGDISQETVNCYVELMEGQRDLYRVDFSRRNLAGVEAYKHSTENSFWGAVQGHLELGDKCLVVTDSSPDKLNSFYHTFTRVTPNKKVEVIHSASKLDEAARDIVNRTNKALTERSVDLLLCSPSITNGVDFNYFDTVFVLTSTDNQTPNMRFQAMMRERNPDTIHYFFHNKKRFSTGYTSTSFDVGFTTQARREYSLRKEKEFKAYIATFNYYLLQAGASLEVLDDPYETPKTPEDAEVAREERIHAILTAGAQDRPLRNNDAYEQRQTLRYYYEIPPDEDIAWDTVGDWVDDKPAVRAEYFYKVFDVVWPYIQQASVDRMQTMLKEQGQKLYLATGESVHGGPHKAKAIMKQCGVRPDDIKSLETALVFLRKYCELTAGAEVPEEIKIHEEQAKDL